MSGSEPQREELESAIEAELAVDPSTLTAEQKGARSLWLRAQHDRLAVAVARNDAEFERTKAFRQLDPSCTKASQWLVKQLRIPLKEARQAYRNARRLALLPLVTAAIVAGTLSWWHATRLARLASAPAWTRRLRHDLAGLIDAARTLDSTDFDLALKAWAEEHFTEEVEADALAAEAARTVSVDRNESAQPTLRARLHPVHGTEVLTELSRIERELFELDWNAAKEVHGDHTRFEHLGRTSEQRRADALVEMARRSDAAKPGAATRRPLATMLIGFEQATTRCAQIEDGTYLTTDQVLRAVADADLERAVLGPDDRIRVGRRARLFTGAERRAIEIRDRHCTEDGCEEPPEWCEGDHVVRYEYDGPTTQANGRLRCVDHHEGRRRDPEDRPQPWEFAEDDWDALEAERAAVRHREAS